MPQISTDFLPFTIQSEGHTIYGDKALDGLVPLVLCLHGAGVSNRKLFVPLRQELARSGVSSIAFDFIGHGETGGGLKESSLKQRFVQSCDVIKQLNLTQPLNLIANSMSGHIAIKLLEKYEIKNLILMVPAVYHAEAYEVGFNQGFSEIIRKPQSWLHSDTWNILEKFEGNLLIISAEQDDVIPTEIIHKLYASASSVKSKQLHCIQKAPHKILSFLNENSSELRCISRLVSNFLELI